jgi:hypothetical protein
MHQKLQTLSASLLGARALLELPFDRPRPPVKDHAGATLDFTLEPALSAQLNDGVRGRRCFTRERFMGCGKRI